MEDRSGEWIRKNWGKNLRTFETAFKRVKREPVIAYTHILKGDMYEFVCEGFHPLKGMDLVFYRAQDRCSKWPGAWSGSFCSKEYWDQMARPLISEPESGQVAWNF